MVQRHILFGSNFMTSVTKYFLALFTISWNLFFYSVLSAIPNWNCLLSMSLKLAGHTFDCETNLGDIYLRT